MSSARLEAPQQHVGGTSVANNRDPEAIADALDQLHRAGWSIGSMAVAPRSDSMRQGVR
jgi:hypothetical protein